MAAKLTDDERQAIVDLIETGKSARDVAREAGRSVDTISRIARDIGWQFGRPNLVRAREAKSAYCAEERAVDAAAMQVRVRKLIAGFDDLEQVAVSTGNGVKLVDVRASARALADRAKAINLLQRTVLDIDRHDNRADSGASAVDDWLRSIIGSA